MNNQITYSTRQKRKRHPPDDDLQMMDNRGGQHAPVQNNRQGIISPIMRSCNREDYDAAVNLIDMHYSSNSDGTPRTHSSMPSKSIGAVKYILPAFSTTIISNARTPTMVDTRNDASTHSISEPMPHILRHCPESSSPLYECEGTPGSSDLVHPAHIEPSPPSTVPVRITRSTRKKSSQKAPSKIPAHATKPLKKKSSQKEPKVKDSAMDKTTDKDKDEDEDKTKAKKNTSTSEDKKPLVSPDSIPNKYFGSFSLYTSRDENVLSPTHCFIRQFCMEGFVATEEDKAMTEFYKARNFKIKPGLVCTRCKYCKHLPMMKRAKNSMHYPERLTGLYSCNDGWYRNHYDQCTHIPADIRKQLEELKNKKKRRTGGRRSYWVESAKKLGMVDTTDGIVAAVDPNVMAETIESELTSSQHGMSLVEPSDRDTISPLLFLLMSNMESCKFAKEDKESNRSKIKNFEIGYPGFQCKHCQGSNGTGRYFPQKVESMRLANSERNMIAHLLHCERCPDATKDAIKTTQKTKNDRGLRKAFFHRAWNKLHGAKEEDVSLVPSEPKEENISLVSSESSVLEEDDEKTPLMARVNNQNIPSISRIQHNDYHREATTTRTYPIYIIDRSDDLEFPKAPYHGSDISQDDSVLMDSYDTASGLQSTDYSENHFTNQHFTVSFDRYQNPDPSFLPNRSDMSYRSFDHFATAAMPVTSVVSSYQYHYHYPVQEQSVPKMSSMDADTPPPYVYNQPYNTKNQNPYHQHQQNQQMPPPPPSYPNKNAHV